MQKNAENYQVEYKKITVRTADGSTLNGKINIGQKQRVSDIFIDSEEQFVVLVDVSLKDSFGKTMFINKRHIVWVEPEDL